MSYPINYPTPQSANVQIFNGGGTTRDWIKPKGATMVWFTLIGAGSGSDNSGYSGSGAVTNCMIPAFFIPDSLQITVGKGSESLTQAGGTDTTVTYQQKNGTGYTLLTAYSATSGSSGGQASTSNYFSAAGFFQSVAGDSGGTRIPSQTTFLSAYGNPGNYGYSGSVFQTRPIIVGSSTTSAIKAPIGCGGYANSGYSGGDGMVVIISW